LELKKTFPSIIKTFKKICNMNEISFKFYDVELIIIPFENEKHIIKFQKGISDEIFENVFFNKSIINNYTKTKKGFELNDKDFKFYQFEINYFLTKFLENKNFQRLYELMTKIINTFQQKNFKINLYPKKKGRPHVPILEKFKNNKSSNHSIDKAKNFIKFTTLFLPPNENINDYLKIYFLGINNIL
jgi:hypothetical protein